MTVNYGLAGSATQGTGFTVVGGTPGTNTFAAGVATANVTVDPTADSEVDLRTDQAKRLKDLEKENARLKRLLADAELDKAILREAALGRPQVGAANF
ncbi:hypothetical protein LBMAG47_13710 [Planctomycetia bacterium]|nr:hypothetical protein LBMAG47_13710 [Planctomycetia bacterium]